MPRKHSLSLWLCLYSLLSSDCVCFLFNLKIVRKNTLISSKRNKHRQRSEGYIPWKLSIVEQSAKQLVWTRECLSPQVSTEGLGPHSPCPHFQSKVRLWSLKTPSHSSGERVWLRMCILMLYLNIHEQKHSPLCGNSFPKQRQIFSHVPCLWEPSSSRRKELPVPLLYHFSISSTVFPLSHCHYFWSAPRYLLTLTL